MTIRPPKTFDCVQMKWGIQERIERELAGLAPEERRLAEQRSVQDDPILGPFLRALTVIHRPLHAGDPVAEHQTPREIFVNRAETSQVRSTTTYPSRDELHERH